MEKSVVTFFFKFLACRDEARNRDIKNKRLLLFWIVITFICPSTSFAFEWTEVNFGLGIFRYDNIRPNNQKTFLKNDPIYEPIPTFQIRVGPFFVNKDGGGVALLYFKELKLLGLVLYEGEPYRTHGMEERKKSFHLGGGIRLFDIEALYYQDVQSRSRGKVFKIYYAPEFKFNNYTFSPRPYAQFWDRKYVDYFFGVRDSEVDLAIGRSAYSGERTTNYGFMLRQVWDVQRIKYILSTGYKFYGSRVFNSPTAVKKEEQRILLGIMYKFF